jgi:hypothetical protein
MRNRSLTRQMKRWRTALAALCCVSFTSPLLAAEQVEDAVSTINHAFATELGTGVYDMGGRSIFVLRLTPQHVLREPTEGHPGIRLVAPIAAGSFDFNPFNELEPEIPRRVDSFSITPGIEFDFPQGGDWMLSHWARVGGSFSEAEADGLLFGVGSRLTWTGERGGLSISRRHEAAVVNVHYRDGVDDDLFLRVRHAIDVRKTLGRVTPTRRFMPGFYTIVDLVPDPPDAPLEAGHQTVVQLEMGLTFNTEPRPRIGPWRWPRLGFGYRLAGDFSGWRIVVGAPF